MVFFQLLFRRYSSWIIIYKIYILEWLLTSICASVGMSKQMGFLRLRSLVHFLIYSLFSFSFHFIFQFLSFWFQQENNSITRHYSGRNAQHHSLILRQNHQNTLSRNLALLAKTVHWLCGAWNCTKMTSETAWHCTAWCMMLYLVTCKQLHIK